MEYKIKRISQNSLININKTNFLKEHFEQIKDIKNNISKDIFFYLKKELNHSLKVDLYHFKLADYKNSLLNNLNKNNNPLTSNEFQKITTNITEHYSNYINQLIQNKHFSTYSFIPLYYKKSRKFKNNSGYQYQKGDFKEYKKIENKTLLSNLVNYLKFIDINSLIDKSFNFNDYILNHKDKINNLFINRYNYKTNNKTNNNNDKNNKENNNKYNLDKNNYNKLRKEIHKEIIKIRKYEELNSKLNKIYNKEYLFNHLINLLKINKTNILKHFHKIIYTTGSYIKIPLFNKNSINPTKHSYIFKDDSNSLLKYWYCFKTPNETKYIPLSYNNQYHRNFKNFDLDKETYISYKNNKLNISLNYMDNEKIIYLETGKSIAIDLNVRDNFLVYFDGLITKEIDYDRKYIISMIKELRKYDKLSKEEKEFYKSKLDKIVRQNEWYFKSLISNILKQFHKDNISQIIMEDLDLSKTSASYIKNEEFQIKYSRLIRLLRLSNMKEWFKEQSKKYGMQVILTNPAYSSQECSSCHYIDKRNRNKDRFECLNCGHKEHSDYNSPKTLYNRVIGNVSLKLHNVNIVNNIDFLVPKKLNHKSIKSIIHNTYGID